MISITCLNITAIDKNLEASLHAQSTPERRLRADTFRNPQDRLRCLAAGALLRHCLGETAPICQEKGGKPYIPGGPHFNLSHSGDWVALAWGDSPVGVDVEKIRQDVRWEALARRYFTPEERSWVREGDPVSRFFEIWTKKESYLKYLGTGLAADLTQTDTLSLAFPHFYTYPLEGHTLTLCAQEPPEGVTMVSPEALLSE